MQGGKLGKVNINTTDAGGLAQYESGQLSLGGYGGVSFKGGRSVGLGGYFSLSWTGCKQ